MRERGEEEWQESMIKGDGERDEIRRKRKRDKMGSGRKKREKAYIERFNPEKKARKRIRQKTKSLRVIMN